MEFLNCTVFVYLCSKKVFWFSGRIDCFNIKILLSWIEISTFHSNNAKNGISPKCKFVCDAYIIPHLNKNIFKETFTSIPCS